jgi:hypothetical protein
MSERAEHDRLETTAVNATRIIMAAVGILVFLGTSIGMSAFTYYTLVPRSGPPAPLNFPQPRLEAHPSVELQHYLAQQRERLNGYHWASSDHAFVAIPIDRAMANIAVRGTEAYGPIAPQQQPPIQRQP